MKFSKLSAFLFMFFFSMTVMAGQNCGNPAGHCVCGNCPVEAIERLDECMSKSKNPNRKEALEQCIKAAGADKA